MLKCTEKCTKCTRAPKVHATPKDPVHFLPVYKNAQVHQKYTSAPKVHFWRTCVRKTAPESTKGAHVH